MNHRELLDRLEIVERMLLDIRLLIIDDIKGTLDPRMLKELRNAEPPKPIPDKLPEPIKVEVQVVQKTELQKTKREKEFQRVLAEGIKAGIFSDPQG